MTPYSQRDAPSFRPQRDGTRNKIPEKRNTPRNVDEKLSLKGLAANALKRNTLRNTGETSLKNDGTRAERSAVPFPRVRNVEHAGCWRDRFEERCAIIEYDGGVSRSEAETQAWECTVIQWMNETPPKGIDDDRCASCGHHIGDVGRDAVPFLSGGGGHVWLHHGCHPTWMTRRRSDAEKALTAMGVTSP